MQAGVINTCSVRATAEQRIFGRLGFFTGLKAVRAKTPGAKNKSLEIAAEFVKDGAKPLTLVMMGCMAERLLHSLKKDWPCVDYVVVFSVSGAMIANIVPAAGMSEVAVDMSTAAPGLYIVNVVTSNGYKSVNKIIKK